jgi:hypothetical protein
MHVNEGLDIGFSTENFGTNFSVLCRATYIETSWETAKQTEFNVLFN